MDLTLLQKKELLPLFVMDKLATVSLDYKEKNLQIDKSRKDGCAHLKAAVVLLLDFRNINGRSEYVFQLIKRSETVSQAGDISCPGGMLQPRQDNMMSAFLKTGMLPALRGIAARHIQKVDNETATLIRLFLSTALREAWEEIGLNPLNTKFLGALPSYSLTMFARTIFPVVCMTRKQFTYKPNDEVEKILEIPLSFFFNGENYATLDVATSLGDNFESFQYQTPCFIIPDENGNEDILWGATLNIIHNFLRIVFDGCLPSSHSSRIVNKRLTIKYISPRD